MKETSPEKPRFEILPLRAVPAGPRMDMRESDPRPTAGLSHQSMTSKRPRGPPDSTRSAREGGSAFSLHEE
jgi:hypothetical protein